MQSVLQLGINEYADLTWEEFRASKLGLKAGHDGSFRCNLLLCCTAESAARIYNSLKVKSEFPEAEAQVGLAQPASSVCDTTSIYVKSQIPTRACH